MWLRSISVQRRNLNGGFEAVVVGEEVEVEGCFSFPKEGSWREKRSDRSKGDPTE